MQFSFELFDPIEPGQIVSVWVKRSFKLRERFYGCWYCKN